MRRAIISRYNGRYYRTAAAKEKEKGNGLAWPGIAIEEYREQGAPWLSKPYSLYTALTQKLPYKPSLSLSRSREKERERGDRSTLFCSVPLGRSTKTSEVRSRSPALILRVRCRDLSLINLPLTQLPAEHTVFLRSFFVFQFLHSPVRCVTLRWKGCIPRCIFFVLFGWSFALDVLMLSESIAKKFNLLNVSVNLKMVQRVNDFWLIRIIPSYTVWFLLRYLILQNRMKETFNSTVVKSRIMYWL